METIKQKTENIDFSRLVSKLKTEDVNYARISRAIQIMYLIFIPVFAVMTFREYNDTGDINELISGGSFILAFLIFALFFGRYYKEYKFVDYSLPTVVMLKKAAYRYQPFQLQQVWVLLAILLIDVGLTFDWMDETPIAEIQATFAGTIVFGVVVGLIIWYFKYKPLRDEALKLIAEIEQQ